MKNHKYGLLLFFAILPVFPALCSAGQLADFEAKLELYRNDKLHGEMIFKLTTGNDRWTMQSSTEGTKGVASWLGLKESSTGEGDWFEGEARPLRYERNVRVIKKMHWSAEFDWDKGIVHTVYPDGESTLQLKPGVVDESAIGLRVRAGLKNGEDEWFLDLVDEEKIEEAHFRTRSVENVQTALGCMKVHVVEKVRWEGNPRYTRTYYAADHEFAPVLLEHGKYDGDHIEGRVVSLTINGKPVAAGPDCPP
jgi:hypothetical protein